MKTNKKNQHIKEHDPKSPDAIIYQLINERKLQQEALIKIKVSVDKRAKGNSSGDIDKTQTKDT